MPVSPAPVTVVTPAYNHADHILTSLHSVLGLETPPREVIVVDDGSPDDTAERVAPLARAGRVRYVRQANAGMAAARNAGAQLATSEYLYFLDDDDLTLPGGLARLVEELERYPDAAFAYGQDVHFRGDPPDPPPPPAARTSRAVDLSQFLVFTDMGSPGQALIRRRAFLEVGGFDASIWGTDDWDLWLRLLARYPARKVHQPVLAYRMHAENASRNMARMYRSSRRVARHHLAAAPAERRPILQWASAGRLRRAHDRAIAAQVRREVRAGEWRRAAVAAGAWALAWADDLRGRVGVKAHLLRRGRWRMPADEPVLQLSWGQR